MVDIDKVKTMMVIHIKGKVEPVISSRDTPFVPFRLDVTDFGDRARVQAVGRGIHSVPGSNSATFKLYGYKQYRPVPHWIRDVIRLAGYGGDIDLSQPKVKKVVY